MSYFTHTVVQCTHQVFVVNKKKSLKSVNVVYNNSFRSSIFSLLRRLQDSDNPLFDNYFDADIHFSSPMFKYWTTQLYG